MKSIVFKSFIFSLICVFASASTMASTIDPGVGSLKETGKAFASIAKRVSPSVVFLHVEQEVTEQNRRGQHPLAPFGQLDPGTEEFLEFFFGHPRGGRPREKQTVVGQGSGFLWGHNGYIITNYHVVGKESKIVVKFLDGKKMDAKLVGFDQRSDIAVIKVEGEFPDAVKTGRSDTLEVGEWVVAIGNPFGLSHTMTAGIVSAIGRNSVGITDFEDFIQTDAAINPGNSGGPLVNLDGEVVGVNTAIFSRSGGYMGIGFAIPIDMVRSIATQIIDNGSVAWGYLGVRIQELTTELSKAFGLKEQKGILVAEVEKQAPAEKAGILQGDIIIQLDGKPVTNVGQFRNKIATSSPKSKHTLVVLRNGKEKTLSFNVGTMPAEMNGQSDGEEPGDFSLDKVGINVQDITPEISRQLGLEQTNGVVITQTSRGSMAERAGLQPGTVILEANREKVKSVKQLRNIIKDDAKDGQIMLLVQDQRGTRYIVLSF